jgi:hypothetical protein
LFVNPNLQTKEYYNITSTYYNSLYIQIIRKYLTNEVFNFNLIDLINYILSLRKEYKILCNNEDNYYTDVQMACEKWLIYIFGYLNMEESLAKSSLNTMNLITDIGRSIMSGIYFEILRNGEIDNVLYFDTDEVVTTNLDVSKYFKTIEPKFTYHSENYSKIEFLKVGNLKPKKILYR